MSKKAKKIIISVKDISEGAKTHANYQFQYGCTAIIAINMYNKNFKFKEIFCEVFEDVLGIKNNNHVVGIQIKHRENKYGAFPITDPAIIQTIKKFGALDNQFSKNCDEFIFMSNMQIVFDGKKSLEELSKECKNNSKKLPKKIEKVIEGLQKKTGMSKEQIIQILSKMKYVLVPDRDHIVDTIVNKHLSTVSECKTLHQTKLNDIANSLIEMIEKKSTFIQDSLILYSAFLEKVDKENQIVSTKRIIPEDIRDVIKKGATYIYLDSKQTSKITVGSYGLIDTKMNLGRINQSEIENMKTLTKSAQSFILEKYHEEESEQILHDYQDVETRLLTIQAECETEARNQDISFGSKKLELVEKKLHAEVENTPEKFHYFQYEHLKGILGILMTRCAVPFSDKPEGGWI